jgi:hypothetical protein
MEVSKRKVLHISSSPPVAILPDGGERIGHREQRLLDPVEI